MVNHFFTINTRVSWNKTNFFEIVHEMMVLWASIKVHDTILYCANQWVWLDPKFVSESSSHFVFIDFYKGFTSIVLLLNC